MVLVLHCHDGCGEYIFIFTAEFTAHLVLQMIQRSSKIRLSISIQLHMYI